jgi:predicted nucleic acid-binding protein
MYVLDTNVVSELRKAKAGKANPGVVGWATAVPAALMFLSAITLHELEPGVLLAERNDPPAGALLRMWLDLHVLPTFAERVLPVDGTWRCGPRRSTCPTRPRPTTRSSARRRSSTG